MDLWDLCFLLFFHSQEQNYYSMELHLIGLFILNRFSILEDLLVNFYIINKMFEDNYQTKNIDTKSIEELHNSLDINSELPAKTDGFMYIIRSIDEQGKFTDTRCKIGETTKNVYKYVAQEFNPKNPYKLKVVGILRGGEWETIFHIRYKKYHIQNEWFDFTDEMVEFIKLLENKRYKVKLTIKKLVNIRENFEINEENYRTKIIETKSLEVLYNNLHENSELPGKTDGYMYIIRSIDEQGVFTDNRCKIGKTGENIDEYIAREFNPKNPYSLRVVGILRGKEWEPIFLIRYSKFNIHHEWFEFRDEMLNFIKLLENKGYKVI